MIQKFIELGSEFTDLYEWIEILNRNQDRIVHIFAFTSHHNNRQYLSYAIALTPTQPGDFQPIYICREGITLKDGQSKRKDLITFEVEKLGKTIIPIDVKHSSFFETSDLFYNYLIALLRLNHLIPPLQ